MQAWFRSLALLPILALLACGPTESVSDHPDAGPARRIVTLAPHLGELVFTAGAGEYLVGVSEFTDFPPPAAELPRVGDAFRADYEMLASLSPDLILSWSSGTSSQLVTRLRDLGYRVVALEAESITAIADQIEVLGELAGTETIARKAAAQYRKTLNKLRDEYAGRELLSVFYQVAEQPLLTVSDAHIIGQVIHLCGGQNSFGEMPDLVPVVSPEAVLDASPAVILAGAYVADEPPNFDYWRQWKNLSAARNGYMFGVNADLLSRPGPRLLVGARELCEVLDQARTEVLSLAFLP